MLYVHGNIEVAGNLYLGSTGHDVRYVGTGHIHSGGGTYIGGDVLPTGLLGVDDLLGISADGDVSVSCQGNCRQLGLFVHAEGVFIAEGELHFAGCLTASEAVTPEGAAFYEVPAVSSTVCCSPDRWFVSSGNSRREAYWAAE